MKKKKHKICKKEVSEGQQRYIVWRSFGLVPSENGGPFFWTVTPHKQADSIVTSFAIYKKNKSDRVRVKHM